MDKCDTTIVICCAGVATRLGIGTSKALVSICGKPLIIHQLEMLKDFDDIRIVVGYQAEQVIETVLEYRKDVMFVFNYDYVNSGIADSLQKALISPRKYVIEIDGDLIINPDDFKRFQEYNGECIASNYINSEEPVYLITQDNMVVGFSRDTGDMEWTCLAKIESSKLKTHANYIYEIINNLLPLPYIRVRARDIDTAEDYDNVVQWFKNGYMD